jgi:hypothetical protein
MNSTQIRIILAQVIPGSFQTGVYACDELHQISSDNFAVILNTDKGTDDGEHWLALFKEKHSNVIEYFDSFGKDVNYYSHSNLINQFLNNRGMVLEYSIQQLQSFNSNVCGQFCIYYLANRVSRLSFKDILLNFSVHKLEKNDLRVKMFVETNFMRPIYSVFDNLVSFEYNNSKSIQCCKRQCKIVGCHEL